MLAISLPVVLQYVEQEIGNLERLAPVLAAYEQRHPSYALTECISQVDKAQEEMIDTREDIKAILRGEARSK